MKKNNRKGIERFDALFPESLLTGACPKNKDSVASFIQSAKNLYAADQIERSAAETNGGNVIRLLKLAIHCAGPNSSYEVTLLKHIIQQVPTAKFN